MINKPAFYVDMEACTGCKTCMVACMDKNDLPAGTFYRRVIEYTGGEWKKFAGATYSQTVFSYYISISCNHCANSICIRSCSTGAMNRDEYGIVSVDHNKCVGCRYCEWACPYFAPQYRETLKQMTKCDFCRDLLLKGQEPACVSACPMRAIHYGSFDVMVQQFGLSRNIAPLPDPSITLPHYLFKPSHNARPASTHAGAFIDYDDQ